MVAKLLQNDIPDVFEIVSDLSFTTLLDTILYRYILFVSHPIKANKIFTFHFIRNKFLDITQLNL